MKPIPLNTLFIARKHIHFESIDSTNAEAQRLIKSNNEAEGLLITANEQKEGKGYTGNKWNSEAGKNILMTLVLKPEFLEARYQFYLNQCITLALYDTLSKLCDKDLLEIKWPNDMVYDGKKLCGILIENILSGNKIQTSFIGIGLNINQEKFPKELKNATSLAIIHDKQFSIERILGLLCDNIEARYLQLKRNDITNIQKDYMSHLFQLEEMCTYKIEGKKVKGKIVGLNPEGKLVINAEKGYHVCALKEVEFM